MEMEKRRKTPMQNPKLPRRRRRRINLPRK